MFSVKQLRIIACFVLPIVGYHCFFPIPKRLVHNVASLYTTMFTIWEKHKLDCHIKTKNKKNNNKRKKE